MPAVWLLTIAIFAPLLTGLATLLLPRGAITARVLLATAGPALAFALVLNHLNTQGLAEPVHTDAYSVPVQHHGEDHGHADDASDTHHDHEPASAQADTHATPHATHATDLHTASDVGPDAAENPLQTTGVLPWMPSLHIELAYLTDGLGSFFAMLVAGIGVMICLYARGYFGPVEDDLYRFYPTLGFFATAMLGVALADYMLLTLLFWELTSISSFLLIGWDRYDRKAVKLAMQAFFTTGLGGMGLFGGILLFGSTTDIWRWSELLVQWDQITFSTPVIWSFVLMLLGAASKSAQWPWHYWLPGAMAAPTPVSAYLHSATMVKAGVFLTGRLFPIFSQLDLWPWIIVPLGGFTMVYAALLAVNQHDLKRIFAYTTVSQLGLLMCMYGLGGLQLENGGAILDYDITQIANHAFYKAPLFIIAGAIGHVAATRDLPRLYGFWRAGIPQKIMVVVMLVAGYALAGGPGTISFPAKELFLYAIYHAAEQVSPVFWVLMAAAVITAMCNVAIFIRLFTTLLGLKFAMFDKEHFDEYGHFSPPPPDHVHDAHFDEERQFEPGHDEAHHHEGGVWGAMMWFPAAAIVSLQVLGGLFPPFWNALFLPLEVHASYFHPLSYTHGMPTLYGLHLSLPLMMSALAIALGVLLGLSPFMRGAIKDVHDRIYPAMYWLAVTGGGYAFRLVQRGSLRFYIVAVLGALFVMCGIALANGDMRWTERISMMMPLALENWAGALLGLVFCTAVVAMPLNPSRIVRVILLGVCGFSVVGFYVIYQAPDLALTQLMVEVISVILFVLVLRLLPDEQPQASGKRWWRVTVAVLAGALFAMLTLVAAPTAASRDERNDRYQLLGEYFAENSYKGQTEDAYGETRGGGGRNMVNVILVDFRGFDTLGEITVLSLAGMGVWSLITARRRNRNPQEPQEAEA